MVVSSEVSFLGLRVMRFFLLSFDKERENDRPIQDNNGYN